MEQSTQTIGKTQLNYNTFQFMRDLSGEEHQEVVNTPMKKKLREPGYLQGIIIIEILKKKDKEND